MQFQQIKIKSIAAFYCIFSLW